MEMQNFKGSRSLLDRVLSWTTSIFPRPIEVIQLLVPFSKNVRDAKLRQKYAEELLKHACEQLSQYSLEDLLKIKDHNGVPSLIKILVIAAEHGTVEVIRVCLQYFPELIWEPNVPILATAVENRRENVVNLLNKTSGRNWMLTNKATDQGTGTNILHKTAKLAPRARLQYVSGSPFQFQRELQWYKEMEKLVDPKFIYYKEKDGWTPWPVFLDEHGKLIEEGEKWMRGTANQCMVVSALITTVVFAAAFTVPGGQNDQGIPVFSGQKSFMVFAISDAAALFSSVIAILMFLSILTSRFAPDDFLKSLPQKLIFGLASLFFSLAAMMVAFGATLTFVFRGTWKWVATPVTLLASFPAIMFVWLQLPLFVQMVRYTFGPGIFHPEDIWKLGQKGAMQTQYCEC